MASSAPVVNSDLPADAQNTPVRSQVTGPERRGLAQLQEANTQLSDENCRMKEEVKRGESLVQHCVNALQTRLEAAEKALADKQAKMNRMKQEISRMEKELEFFRKEKELVTTRFREMCIIENGAARAAREEEKRRMCLELETLEAQNHCLCLELETQRQQKHRLQEELDALARQSVTAIQGRHWPLQGVGPEGGAAAHSRGPEISEEVVNALLTRLEAAEKALADKQAKMNGMKQEIFRKEKELETTSGFQIEGVWHYPVNEVARAARDEEKRRLRDELEDLEGQNRCLRDELEALEGQNHCLKKELEALKQQNRCLQEELDGLARCGEHPRAHLSQM